MQAHCEQAEKAAAFPLGWRAALELDLLEAKRQLEAAQAQRAEYDSQSIECRALADEYRADGKHVQAQAMTAASVRYRCRVISADVELIGLRANVAVIEAELSAAPAAPVVLTAEQCAAVDDTIGALA